MEKEKKNFFKNKTARILLKLILTAIVLFVSWIIGFILLLLCSSSGVIDILTFCSTLVTPGLLLPLIYAKKKKIVFKIWTVCVLILAVCLGVNIGVIKYDESITINTNPNINTSEYLPFTNNSKIVKLDHEASLKLKDNLPIVDGAAAVFPVYSAFVNAVYPNTTTLNDGVFEYNNTVRGYRLLGEKRIDIFFGAYPSETQIEDAKENNTEFEYTKIGTEAFVFFVHKDNPITSLTADQIRRIYAGEITNWKEVGGKNEEIVAFQRNEGSGSQSMLIRFMDGKKIMKAPTEQVNDMMSGIIERVSNYRNKTNSIGFSFRYYLEGIIKNPDVKMVSIDGISPTVENIKNGSYPITTSLYAVTYKDNPNENVDKLIKWVLSKEGQEIIEKTGYVGIEK
ncbi:MAG: substrate-binding domain-containing protein [Clostridia bacterium]|nr:substrate-binding domain-containing protein [Clostridia bacterium]